MFKKSIIIASVMAFTISASAFAAPATTPTVTPQTALTPAQPAIQKPQCTYCNKAKKDEMRKQQCEAFDKRLKLTDAQKEQAKQIRQKGHDEIKPIMEKIKAKHEEAKMVKLSRIAPQMQEEKLNKINAELKELRHQAHELRQQNMKEFEAILTPKQNKELNKMKQKGKKHFEQQRKQQKCKCEDKTNSDSIQKGPHK